MPDWRRLVNYLVVFGAETEALREEARRLSAASVQGGGAGDRAAGGPTAETPAFVAVALERFPITDYSNIPLTPMISNLPEFCFPNGFRLQKEKPHGQSPAFLPFCLTDGVGARLYAACLRVHEKRQLNGETWYAPKALCLLSLLPCLETLRRLLRDLLVAARSEPDHLVAPSRNSSSEAVGGGGAGLYARRLVAQLFYEVPLPPDHTTQVVFCAGGGRSCCFLDQAFCRDFSFRPLLACLSITRIMQLLVLIMLERRVVLASQIMNPALLSAVCEVLLAVTFPFTWEHPYVPLMPQRLIVDMIECPSPFLIGAPGGVGDIVIPEGVSVFDLDKDEVRPVPVDIPAIPEAIEQPLLTLKQWFPLEQRAGNRQHWARFHLEEFPAPGARRRHAAGRRAPAVNGGAVPRPATEAKVHTSTQSANTNEELQVTDVEVQLGPTAPEPESHDGASASLAGSPRPRFHHRRSASLSSAASPTSADSGDDSAGEDSGPRMSRRPSIISSSSGSTAPAWSEEQERQFRLKVSAAFVEVFVLLLHGFPQFLRPGGPESFDTEGLLAQAREEHGAGSAHAALLHEFLRSNLWLRFLELPPENPRVQLFRQACDLYDAWRQEPKERRQAFGNELRSFVARIYEPSHTIAAPARGGACPEPLALTRAKRRRSRYGPLRSLVATAALPLQMGASAAPWAMPTPMPPSPCPSPAQRRRHWQHWQMPADAAFTFSEAVTPALATMQSHGAADASRAPAAADFALLPRLLGHLAGAPECGAAEHCGPWALGLGESSAMCFGGEVLTAVPPAATSLVGSLSAEDLLGAEVLEPGGGAPAGGPELRTTCLLQDIREVRDPCPACGERSSFWEILRSAVAGQSGPSGRCSVACSSCGQAWEPIFTLSRALRSRPFRSRLGDGDVARAVPILSLRECLARIGEAKLEGLANEALQEEAPEVYWCLRIFFGLRIELFKRDSSGAPSRIGCATFDAACKAFLELRRREASCPTTRPSSLAPSLAGSPLLPSAGPGPPMLLLDVFPGAAGEVDPQGGTARFLKAAQEMQLALGLDCSPGREPARPEEEEAAAEGGGGDGAAAEAGGGPEAPASPEAAKEDAVEELMAQVRAQAASPPGAAAAGAAEERPADGVGPEAARRPLQPPPPAGSQRGRASSTPPLAVFYVNMTAVRRPPVAWQKPSPRLGSTSGWLAREQKAREDEQAQAAEAKVAAGASARQGAGPAAAGEGGVGEVAGGANAFRGAALQSAKASDMIAAEGVIRGAESAALVAALRRRPGTPTAGPSQGAAAWAAIAGGKASSFDAPAAQRARLQRSSSEQPPRSRRVAVEEVPSPRRDRSDSSSASPRRLAAGPARGGRHTWAQSRAAPGHVPAAADSPRRRELAMGLLPKPGPVWHPHHGTGRCAAPGPCPAQPRGGGGHGGSCAHAGAHASPGPGKSRSLRATALRDVEASPGPAEAQVAAAPRAASARGGDGGPAVAAAAGAAPLRVKPESGESGPGGTSAEVTAVSSPTTPSRHESARASPLAPGEGYVRSFQHRQRQQLQQHRQLKQPLLQHQRESWSAAPASARLSWQPPRKPQRGTWASAEEEEEEAALSWELEQLTGRLEALQSYAGGAAVGAPGAAAAAGLGCSSVRSSSTVPPGPLGLGPEASRGGTPGPVSSALGSGAGPAAPGTGPHAGPVAVQHRGPEWSPAAQARACLGAHGPGPAAGLQLRQTAWPATPRTAPASPAMAHVAGPSSAAGPPQPRPVPPPSRPIAVLLPGGRRPVPVSAPPSWSRSEEAAPRGEPGWDLAAAAPGSRSGAAPGRSAGRGR